MESVLTGQVQLENPPGEHTGDVAWLLYQGECGHEAEADAHQDGVGQLPAGALDHRGVVVLDEHTGGEDGDHDAYRKVMFCGVLV